MKFEVIPIQKLDRVQIGSALITLENLSKKRIMLGIHSFRRRFNIWSSIVVRIYLS